MTFLAESPLSCFEEWGTLRVGWVVDKRAESSIAGPKERLCEKAGIKKGGPFPNHLFN